MIICSPFLSDSVRLNCVRLDPGFSHCTIFAVNMGRRFSCTTGSLHQWFLFSACASKHSRCTLCISNRRSFSSLLMGFLRSALRLDGVRASLAAVKSSSSVSFFSSSCPSFAKTAPKSTSSNCTSSSESSSLDSRYVVCSVGLGISTSSNSTSPPSSSDVLSASCCRVFEDSAAVCTSGVRSGDGRAVRRLFKGRSGSSDVMRL